MKRVIFIVIAVIAALAIPPSIASAGSPHFVTVDVTRTDDSLDVSGKEAGLGNETQVHIVVSATALCINPGDHHPKAANKESVSAQGDFPVQNGKAVFDLTLTAVFQPTCDPPMTVTFTDVTVCDANNGVCSTVGGTF
jgi:hypothetical protein